MQIGFTVRRIGVMIRETGLVLAALALVSTGAAAEIDFKHALTGKPLEFKYRTDQSLTDAVQAFYKSGANPYSGDAGALEAGAKIYKKLCQSCHLKDGTGRVGPNLTDEEWLRERTDTDVGRFEIIYGGGAGAMQPFGRRIDQDEILQVMAFIDTFRGASKSAKAETKAVATPPKPKKKQKSVPPVPFTDAYLNDAGNVTAGGQFWADQCRHCHGAKAYPGKAPKLKPAKYKPDFVYRRITDGFRKMPAWKEQYSDDERMQIVAYILSGQFSP